MYIQKKHSVFSHCVSLHLRSQAISANTECQTGRVTGQVRWIRKCGCMAEEIRTRRRSTRATKARTYSDRFFPVAHSALIHNSRQSQYDYGNP
ncbi:hypothetical protein GJ496_003101 [Pomphorhynchus laevis]|nr:hypothetical protein GJ496_003101 [Pomphorhynchus laevis]